MYHAHAFDIELELELGFTFSFPLGVFRGERGDFVGLFEVLLGLLLLVALVALVALFLSIDVGLQICGEESEVRV